MAVPVTFHFILKSGGSKESDAVWKKIHTQRHNWSRWKEHGGYMRTARGVLVFLWLLQLLTDRYESKRGAEKKKTLANGVGSGNKGSGWELSIPWRQEDPSQRVHPPVFWPVWFVSPSLLDLPVVEEWPRGGEALEGYDFAPPAGCGTVAPAEGLRSCGWERALDFSAPSPRWSATVLSPFYAQQLHPGLPQGEKLGNDHRQRKQTWIMYQTLGKWHWCPMCCLSIEHHQEHCYSPTSCFSLSFRLLM